jgi:hypothetical protein
MKGIKQKIGTLHSLHLDQNILGQPTDFNAAPSGLGLAKELCVDLVESDEIVHVFKEYKGLEDVCGGRVGGGEDGSDVGEDLVLGVRGFLLFSTIAQRKSWEPESLEGDRGGCMSWKHGDGMLEESAKSSTVETTRMPRQESDCIVWHGHHLTHTLLLNTAGDDLHSLGVERDRAGSVDGLAYELVSCCIHVGYRGPCCDASSFARGR